MKIKFTFPVGDIQSVSRSLFIIIKSKMCDVPKILLVRILDVKDENKTQNENLFCAFIFFSLY